MGINIALTGFSPTLQPAVSVEKKYRILLIHDHEEEDLARFSASLEDCVIIPMPNGLRGAEFFFHNDVDLVLLDCLAERSCIEMLQFFKAAKPSVPVIILTAGGSEEFAVTVFRSGARDYLRKPLDMGEVKKSIHTILALREIPGHKEPERPRTDLQRAVRYIHEYFNSPLRLAQVAREAGMSVSCFERKFKESMGMHFNAYVNKVRIEEATQLLTRKEIPVSDVALACGFTNPFHFSRVFRKVLKTTPRLYRKTLSASRGVAPLDPAEPEGGGTVTI